MGGDEVCSGNGKCKGSGTRKGNGKCSCNKEYGGEKCDQCSGNHYESFRDESKLLCSPCHKACEGHCTGSGPKSCAKCKPGFNINTEHGCLDIDECQVGKECEGQNKFCVNTEGCFECAKGFKKGKNDVCVADKNADEENEEPAEETEGDSTEKLENGDELEGKDGSSTSSF